MTANDWLNCNLTELRALYADRVRDLEHEYQRANRAEAEATRLRAALETIGTDCENYTRGRCKDDARERNATFGADRWCNGCIAADALRVTP